MAKLTWEDAKTMLADMEAFRLRLEHWLSGNSAVHPPAVLARISSETDLSVRAGLVEGLVHWYTLRSVHRAVSRVLRRAYPAYYTAIVQATLDDDNRHCCPSCKAFRELIRHRTLVHQEPKDSIGE